MRILSDHEPVRRDPGPVVPFPWAKEDPTPDRSSRSLRGQAVRSIGSIMTKSGFPVPGSGFAGPGSRLRGRLASVVGVGLLIAVGSVLVYLRLGLGPRIEAPPPTAEDGAERVPPIATSSLNVPVTYDVTPVIADLEELVPKTYGSLDERIPVGSNDRASVAFALSRAPFRASLDGDRVRISSVISYRGRGWYDLGVLPEVGASCGTGNDEAPPRLVVALSAKLSLADEWTLSADARVDRVAPVSDRDRDRCRITPLRIDMTDRVVNAANDLLRRHLPDLERAVADIDLRSRFEEWWRILLQPIELDDDVWLVIDPVAVSRGSIRGAGQTLLATVGLSANPRLVLGPRPAPLQSPLPLLDSAEVAEGLRIRATATADYETASERLTHELRGQVIEERGHRIEIRRIVVSGIGAGRLAVELDFTGSARGRVYLIGTPRYDAGTGEVHVPDLDFDVASRNLLVGGLDWLAHGSVASFLRDRARWPVEYATDFAESQLHRGLNMPLSDEVRLRGEVDSVRVVGVYATRASLVVHAAASARAELVVGQPGDEATHPSDTSSVTP